ncbi:hypothetical protein B0J11DRAFT_166675 [Dendryphion nanum]|uniref:Uncharacterized protein n=1 Tax=Dendryphion nanum TaxID=256645 RepID=A0A9P9EEI7_9PLEO|nr:hypothetical protein B0J11DRAFT_166675 [Dendryphion nanum]
MSRSGSRDHCSEPTPHWTLRGGHIASSGFCYSISYNNRLVGSLPWVSRSSAGACVVVQACLSNPPMCRSQNRSRRLLHSAIGPVFLNRLRGHAKPASAPRPQRLARFDFESGSSWAGSGHRDGPWSESAQYWWCGVLASLAKLLQESYPLEWDCLVLHDSTQLASGLAGLLHQELALMLAASAAAPDAPDAADAPEMQRPG